MMSRKGRPTSDPKTGRLEIRTSEKEEEMLRCCCEETGKSRADIVRMGIKKIYDKIMNG